MYISFVTFVCPHETTRLSVDGFSLNLVLEYLSKMCREIQSVIKIWQSYRVLYTKTCVSRWMPLKMRIADRNTFLIQYFCTDNRAICEVKVEKYGRESDRSQMTIRRMRFACWITKTTDTQSEYVIFTAFPRQQWFHERASLLRFTCIACLVLPFLWTKDLWFASVRSYSPE